jgi:hypothetical protein
VKDANTKAGLEDPDNPANGPPNGILLYYAISTSSLLLFFAQHLLWPYCHRSIETFFVVAAPSFQKNM